MQQGSKGEQGVTATGGGEAIESSAFLSYQKIRHTTDERKIGEILRVGVDKAEWVAMEKIHGANFALYTTGMTIKAAKRKSILNPSDRFLAGYEKVVEDHKTPVRKLFKVLKKSHPTLRLVRVFGELFGGEFPGMENPEVKRVQKGVFYSPNLHFIAFDVHVVTGLGKTSNTGGGGGGEGGEEEKEEKAMFLDYDKVARGTFKEVEQFDVESFESRIPEILGLKKPPNNIAEGIVMRPVKEALSERGSRFILKKKSEAFYEVSKSPRPRSRSPSPAKANNNSLKLDQKTIAHIGKDLERYVNENRLRSVLSKILGEISETKDAQRVVRLMFDDVMEDFEDSVHSSRNGAGRHEAKGDGEVEAGQPKDDSKEKSSSTSSKTSTLEMFKNLAGRKQNQVKSELRQRIRKLVAKHIDDIIKNEF